MFKKILITIAAMVLFVGCVQAADNKFIMGYGAKVTLDNSNTKNVMPMQYVGFSYPVQTEGQFGFLIPDEAYTIAGYGRESIDVLDETGEKVDKFYTDYYDLTVKGVYYFTKDSLSTSKFYPFLFIAGNIDVISGEGQDTETNISSDFGIGTGYSLSSGYGLWTGHSLKLGSTIVYNGAVGLYFNL